MIAIAVVTVIPCLLALIYIGSSTVYEDVVSLSVSGLYASYLIPCSLLLWRRTTGRIRTRSEEDDINFSDTSYIDSSDGAHGTVEPGHDLDPTKNVANPPLVWGPWRIPGVLGIVNNAFACLFIVFVLFWSFWPPKTPATPENMNYSVLMTSVVMIFSVSYYYFRGKRQYFGPLIDRGVRAFARSRK